MKTILTILICISIHLVFGQTIHIRSGVNTSSINATYHPYETDPSDYWNMGQFPSWYSKQGLGGNLFLGIDYLQKNRFYITSDLGLQFNSVKGNRLVSTNYGVTIPTETKSSFFFLSIANYAKLKVLNKENFECSIGVGPQYNQLIENQMYTDDFFELHYKTKEQIKFSLDISAISECSFIMGKSKVGVSVGYNHNIIKLMDYTVERWSAPYYPTEENTINLTMDMSHLFVNLSYGITLGKKD